jgi:PPIC-type PPIASE domain
VTENHGSLPSITVSQLPPTSKAFADAVLEMEEGDISRPVQTDFGWHVIHVQGKDVTPYREVRDDLVGQLADPAFADHERALLEDGSIEVNPRFGRLDPQSLTVLRITSTDPVGATPTGPVNVAPEG